MKNKSIADFKDCMQTEYVLFVTSTI